MRYSLTIRQKQKSDVSLVDFKQRNLMYYKQLKPYIELWIFWFQIQRLTPIDISQDLSIECAAVWGLTPLPVLIQQSQSPLFNRCQRYSTVNDNKVPSTLIYHIYENTGRLHRCNKVIFSLIWRISLSVSALGSKDSWVIAIQSVNIKHLPNPHFWSLCHCHSSALLLC
jgi:hypothetical protein